MSEALAILTSIAVVLIAGLVATIIASKLKIPNVLLLLFLGIILRMIQYNGAPIFEFSPTLLVSLSILALVMITFDGSSRLTFKDVEMFSSKSIRVVGYFLLTNVLLVSTSTLIMFYHNFSIESVIYSLIFAVIMAGTDPGVVFTMLKDQTSKVIEVLEIESIINTPIIVILPFLLLDFLTGGNEHVVDSFLSQILPFLTQIIVGIGAGIVVGIVIFKAMKNVYHHELSPLGVITAALLSYILAENLGGNGILSVATMGLFFGNIYVKKKFTLQEFSAIFSNALEILVFVLVGYMISLEFTFMFFLKSVTLFLILLLSRWLAIYISLKDTDFSLSEKIFMTLNIPKGIAVAAVIFSISIKQLEGLNVITNLILIFVVYSLIIATVVGRMAHRFLKNDIDITEPVQDDKPEKEPEVNPDVEVKEVNEE